MDLVYLDNNATTQPAPEVVDAVDQMLREHWANPSSVHRAGQEARQRVELARQQVADLIHCKPRELIFTSGGTEANNLAIRGLLASGGTLITSSVEHSAVREPAEAFEAAGGTVVRLAVSRQGVIDPVELAAALQTHPGTESPVLVSLQWANNETGVIQPMIELAAAVNQARERARDAGRRAKVYLHVDAVQAPGKLPVDVAALGVDLLSLSAHKFHGPKGVGALYIRSGVRLRPQVRGGPQEREKRGGTENTPGIVGMGVAAELAARFVADEAAVGRVRVLRDHFETQIQKQMEHVHVNGAGPGVDRLWNTSNLAFPHLEAEAILLGLSERGVCASAGAACSSGSLDPSPVLLAMGVPEPAAHGSVRFSLCRHTTEAEIERALAVIPEVVARLGKTLPVGD